MNQIDGTYRRHVRHRCRSVQYRNLLLLGRSRSGISTFKDFLKDPRTIATDCSVYSQTRDVTTDSFIIDDSNLVLNVTDTPGWFQHWRDEADFRDNQEILQTIKRYIERETRRFHVMGFCVSISSGFGEEDFALMRLVMKYLGPQAANNCCLIFTRCESKSEAQQNRIRDEIRSEITLKPLLDYCKLGIFFSGCLNHDDYIAANELLYKQFQNIVSYRDEFIQLLSRDIVPFTVQDSNPSGLCLYSAPVNEAEVQKNKKNSNMANCPIL